LKGNELPLIIRASHVELIFRDLGKAREFYVDTLGFNVTEEDEHTIYLRGFEDRMHHSFVLREGKHPGLGHMAYRVESNEDLERAERLLTSLGIRCINVERPENGQGRAIRFQDSFGFPIELFHDMEQAEWLLQRYALYSGARVLRLDHFNVMTPDADAMARWYMEHLGFKLTEYVDDGGKMSAAWLRRKPSSHDIAIMSGAGPRFHHAGFYVSDRDAILDCADIMASRGHYANIERGPGRHGITNAFFLYVRDPEGNRIEFYTGDYLAAEPDFRPVVWRSDDPQRQTFWASPTPESWWKEASPVNSVLED
jgi:catechol 2,3-dioxygenase